MQRSPSPPLCSPDYLDCERQWAYWRAALTAALRDVRAQDAGKDAELAVLTPKIRQEVHDAVFPHFGNEASLLALDFALNAVANTQCPPKEKIKFNVSMTDVASAAMRYSAQTLHSYVQAHGFMDGLLGASMALHAQLAHLSHDIADVCLLWSQLSAEAVAAATTLACEEAVSLAGANKQEALAKLFCARLHALDAATIMESAQEITESKQNPNDLALALIALTEPNLSWKDSEILAATDTSDISLKMFCGEVSKKIMAKG